MRFTLRGWRLALPLAALAAVVSVGVSSALAGSKAKTVKLAIMSDCKGAFGFAQEQGIAGAQAALAQYAHGKPKNSKKESAGMTGVTAGGAQIKIVGYGCGDDTPATALKAWRRRAGHRRRTRRSASTRSPRRRRLGSL